ncbi:uncharacterized protein K460DRAFT_367281 [Cucurbitaria berberidis CBS 394.84]|uniref:Rhodopsin domain-containing protein n=1 Tax=Cucurbitaria berberidis CBS 394.84 TaxID=1168544 RepID=A0A9P4GI03_9PLEO|nr:uncharacterized protein K460DRAFT_367281 [Cucurbitaria berberidis CBS 394.84]KAF1846523.1 hypothetical protein K460DRAFT_367281 [Cucurbitaria berberidis CBS 394.84]
MSLAIPPGTDLSKVPIAPNPSGAPPNFVDPPSLAAVTYGITSTMMVLACGLVGLRILSVIKKERGLKTDDYCCILALILSSGYGILIMLSNKTARHAWDTPISLLNDVWFKRNAALSIIYGPAMFFAKAAICTLYLRIFNTMAWMRYTAWGTIVILACIYGSMVPVYLVYSIPYGNEKWDLTLAAKIGKADKMAIGIGAVNVAFDIFLLILPVPIIMKLNLSFRKRIGLSAVFMTGIVATVSTVLGLYFRISVYRSKRSPTSGDATWVAAATYITVLVELYVTVMVSCVPGCVSSWRNILRETTVITTLRSLINSSRASLSRSRNSSRDGRTKTPSVRSDEAGLAPKHEFELQERKDKEVGITKTIKIQQTEV